MKRYQSILALILAFCATLLVSCSTPAAAPPVYTPTQVEQIQLHAPAILAVRDRMPELGALIQNQERQRIMSFIRGPFGDLRRDMNELALNLAPSDQKAAKKIAKNLFNHLVNIDLAARDENYALARSNYTLVLDDFEQFLKYVPES